ncbi:MAG: DNA polymerase III subunit delta [Ruminococcus sp.]|nr:DNA polymerase III subunit delta [Ruminococcus sp.]MCM1382429.1 DNA polymerase III subunit delta [Muribaculaceae bacterium]MCM1478901.1 DNA polymerase III subunit delta [Muribaculaceae bacterium]
MATVTESILKTSIKNREFKNAYYFYGRDTAAVEAYTKALVSKIVDKDNADYNLHRFDGKTFDLDTFSDACDALPVFAEYVCCTVCDLVPDQAGAEVMKSVVSIVGNLPETTVLIFYYTSVDVTDGKKSPAAKHKKLIDAVDKVGGVCNFALKTPAVLAKEIMAKVSKAGCGISREAAFFLAEQCSCNTLMIENEIDKLTAYAKGNEITADTVRALSPRQIETTSFDLAKAIAQMDSVTAMRLLNDLTEEKIEPIPILYAVTGNMLDLYRAKAAVSCGRSPEDVKSDFGYARNVAFRVDNAFRDVNRISMPHIRMCMKILAETDIAMKSVKTPPQILLEEAVVKMLSFRG